MAHRVGTFFILLGLLLIFLFVISDIAKAPVCNYFLVGALSLGVGVALWFRDPAPPPPPSGRFRLLKSTGKKQEKKKP